VAGRGIARISRAPIRRLASTVISLNLASELIAYEGAAADPAPQTEHLGYRMIALEVDDMQKTADYLRTKGALE
jgi:hypothetical protein